MQKETGDEVECQIIVLVRQSRVVIGLLSGGGQLRTNQSQDVSSSLANDWLAVGTPIIHANDCSALQR